MDPADGFQWLSDKAWMWHDSFQVARSTNRFVLPTPGTHRSLEGQGPSKQNEYLILHRSLQDGLSSHSLRCYSQVNEDSLQTNSWMEANFRLRAKRFLKDEQTYTSVCKQSSLCKQSCLVYDVLPENQPRETFVPDRPLKKMPISPALNWRPYVSKTLMIRLCNASSLPLFLKLSLPCTARVFNEKGNAFWNLAGLLWCWLVM